MRILITRPHDDSAALAEKLRKAGHDVISEPMLDIRFASDADVDLIGVQAVLFTSANGVRAFAAADGPRDLPAFTVGDATAAAARAAGFARVESASGRVEDLARLVRERLTPADGALVHISGRDVAGDLGGMLAQAGFEVRRAVLYVAEAADSLSPGTAQALKAGEIDAVLFYSARTAAAFRRLIDQAGLGPSLSRSAAFGLSPAALEPVKALPWARVAAADRPDESELLRLMNDARQTANKSQAKRTGLKHLLAGWSSAKGPSTPAPRPRFLVPLVWLAVLLSLGTFFLQATQPNQSVSNLSPAASLRLTTLEHRVDALARGEAKPAADPQIAAQLKELSDRVDSLAARPAAPSASGDTAALGQRVDALDARVAADRQALADQLADVQKKVANEPPADQLAALTADNKRLSEQVTALQQQIATLQSAREQSATRAGLLLAAGQVALAAANGNAVAPALATLRQLASDNPQLTAAIAELQPVADRAVPSINVLGERFPAVAAAAVRAAQRESPPAAEATTISGWWHELVRRLSSAVTIRRVGEVPGDSVEARTARAEQRLAQHDLAGAVEALDGLTGAPAAAVQGWLADARARLALDKAVADVSSSALAAAGPAP